MSKPRLYMQRKPIIRLCGSICPCCGDWRLELTPDAITLLIADGWPERMVRLAAGLGAEYSSKHGGLQFPSGDIWPLQLCQIWAN